jgi:RNA polymerase sigma factor (sigma-70 family)
MTLIGFREPLSEVSSDEGKPAPSEIRVLDPALEEYRRAPQSEADDLLGQLLTRQVLPVIRGVLRRGEGPIGLEAHDLEAEVLAILVERLRRLRIEGGGPLIGDLRAYAAVVTFNVVSDQRRKLRRDRTRPAETREGERQADPPDRTPDAATRFEERSFLHGLWREIALLPARQATALLLNLRDEGRGNAILLLPLTGVASLREIARVLGMPAERLAELWPRLPLEDATIAEILGTTRQQVINLRKAARERLSRRLRAH